MANFLTLADIQTAVCKAMGDNPETRATEVQAVINQVYLNEILACDELYPLHWLLGMDDSVSAKPRATITALTKANPVVVTAASHGFASGDLVTIYDSDMTEVNGRTFRAVRDSANAFHLHDLEDSNIDGSAYAAAGTEGYAHHRGVTLATTGKDIERLIALDWVNYPNKFSPIGLDELSKGDTDFWNSTLSMPTRYFHKRVFSAAGVETHYLLWFWCPDDDYRLRYWFEFRPARLVNTTDVPLLPYRFHPTIIAGAITRLGENKAQVEAGVIWPQVYKMDLEAIISYNRAWWAKNNPNDRSDLYLL